MRTLIVHTGGIGDFLLTCPALACLAQDGPIELLGYPERLALAVAGGLAESAHSLDHADFSSVFSAPSARLHAFLSRFQRAIVWMRDTGEIQCAFRNCGVSDVRCFPGLPPEGWEQHASVYYAQCIGCQPAPDWKLNFGRTDPDDPSNPANPSFIVVHPGSGSARKNWPMAHFTTVAAYLGQQGHTVRWCLGPAEEPLEIPAMAERLDASSLVELALILQQAALYIGNDSGITHLAAAAGCPTVAIFGPTDPRVWAPRGGHVRVAQGNPWPAPQTVMEALAPLLP